MVRSVIAFNRLRPRNILVAGDVILDHYVFGKCRRISPEAPVPVVHVESEEERAGGAGNVILNLISLGMKVRILGCVGVDSAGSRIQEMLRQEGVDIQGLFQDTCFRTPHKTRIIASSQQIVRVDHEAVGCISKECETAVLVGIEQVLHDIDLIAISDYAKGFLTDAVLQQLIRTARAKNIPVITDPKGTDFKKYAGSTIIKPNFGEAIAAGRVTNNNLDQAAANILANRLCDVLMVTRSEAGISTFFPDGRREDFPVQQCKEVRDVTGAGDTVLAVLSAALANKFALADAVELSNIAANIAVERVGCAQVSLHDMARRLIELHIDTKICCSEHAAILEYALQGRCFTLLDIKREEFTLPLMRTVCQLALLPEELVVRTDGVNEEFVNMLAALEDVDYILLKKNSEHAPFQKIKPIRHVIFDR